MLKSQSTKAESYAQAVVAARIYLCKARNETGGSIGCKEQHRYLVIMVQCKQSKRTSCKVLLAVQVVGVKEEKVKDN